MDERPKHPSGRPVQRNGTKPNPQPPVLYNGPLTPRLRNPERTHAVGFHHEFTHEED